MVYVLKRIFYMIPTLLLGTLLVFVILYLAPGNYVTFLQATNPHFSASQLHEMTIELGLNLSWWQQYLDWLWHVLHGDLGRSYLYSETVIKLVWPRMLNSFVIIALSTFFIYLFGFLIGIYSSYAPGTVCRALYQCNQLYFCGYSLFFSGVIIYLFNCCAQAKNMIWRSHCMV